MFKGTTAAIAISQNPHSFKCSEKQNALFPKVDFHHEKQGMALVVSIMGGPGAGKSTLFHRLAGDIMSRHPDISIAVLHEEVKVLVWLGQFDKLQDQHTLSARKADIIDSMTTKVRLVLVDGALIGDAYYARHYTDNQSDPDETISMIRERFAKHSNFVIHLGRGDLPYVPHGRYQTFGEAQDVDRQMAGMLAEFGIETREISSSQDRTYNGEYEILFAEILAQL